MPRTKMPTRGHNQCRSYQIVERKYLKQRFFVLGSDNDTLDHGERSPFPEFKPRLLRGVLEMNFFWDVKHVPRPRHNRNRMS